jgi:hypothetical protein
MTPLKSWLAYFLTIIIIYIINNNRRRIKIRMIPKCSLDGYNSYLQILALLFMIIILVIVVSYYLQATQCNIMEKYQVGNLDTSTIEYKTEIDAGNRSTYPQDKYPGAKMDLIVDGATADTSTGDVYGLRDCKVYFTDDIKNCDDQGESSTKTCSYKFDGWQEFDTYQDNNGNTLTYPKKIYKPNASNTSELINSHFTSKCFKEFSNNGKGGAKRFEFKENTLVKYDSKGIGDNTQVDTNVFGGKKYTSIQFMNSDDAHDNLTKVIDSICSIKYKPIRHLTGKTFYKFNFDNSLNIRSIEKLALNEDQSGFITVNNTAINDFASLGSHGLRFNDNGQLQIFINDAAINSKMNIYKFNYVTNLCEFAQIKNYTKYPSKDINITNFVSFEVDAGKSKEKIITDSTINEKLNLIESSFKARWKTKGGINGKININYNKEILEYLEGKQQEVIDGLKNTSDTNRNTYNGNIQNYMRDINIAIAKRNEFKGKGNTFTNIINLQRTVRINNSPTIEKIFNYGKGYKNNLLNDLPIPGDTEVSFINTTDICLVFKNNTNQDQKSYTFTVPTGKSYVCDILLVGGGGAGGFNSGGGGGAGGVVIGENVVLKEGSSTLNVGRGGIPSASHNGVTNNGFNSSIAIGGTLILAIGGGGGVASIRDGASGGSGGGGGTEGPNSISAKSTQTASQTLSNYGINGANVIFNGYGFAGGIGRSREQGGWTRSSGGGGGAGGSGYNSGDYPLGDLSSGARTNVGGRGGIGRNVSSLFGNGVGINGVIGGGGGGSSHQWGIIGFGGSGGGGNGGYPHTRADNGMPNTGGGGGGGGGGGAWGGNGGSGIIIIKIKNIIITEQQIISARDDYYKHTDNPVSTITIPSSRIQTNMITSFVYLQKGFYRFRPDIGVNSVPNPNIIYAELVIYNESNLSGDKSVYNCKKVFKYNIHNNKYKPAYLKQYLEIPQNRFYKLAYTYYYLNNTPTSINTDFQLYSSYLIKPPANLEGTLPDGVIAWYRFDNSRADINPNATKYELIDTHGRNNFSNGPLFQNRRFLNTNWGSVKTRDNINLARKSFSISVWMRTKNNDPCYFICQGNHSPHQGCNNYLHIGHRGNGQYLIGFWCNDLEHNSSGGRSYPEDHNTWVHMVFVVDVAIDNRSCSRRMYRNGLLIASDSGRALYQGQGPLYIGQGAYSGEPYNRYNMDISDFIIFNRAINTEEVDTLFKNAPIVNDITTSTSVQLTNTSSDDTLYTANNITNLMRINTSLNQYLFSGANIHTDYRNSNLIRIFSTISYENNNDAKVNSLNYQALTDYIDQGQINGYPIDYFGIVSLNEKINAQQILLDAEYGVLTNKINKDPTIAGYKILYNKIRDINYKEELPLKRLTLINGTPFVSIFGQNGSGEDKVANYITFDKVYNLNNLGNANLSKAVYIEALN